MNVLDLLAVGLSGLLGAITAAGLSGGSSYYILGFQIPQATPTSVVLIVAAIATMIIVKGGLAILMARYTAIVLATIEIKNSVKIARYLFSGSLGRLRNFSRGEISFIINNSTNATFSGVLGAVTSIVIESTLFVSIFIVFLLVDPIAAVGIVLYLALVIYVMQLATGRRYMESGERIKAAGIDTNNSILEMVDAFREVAVLSRQDFFLTQFGEAKKLSVRTNLGLQIIKKLPRYFAETGLIIGIFFFVIWQLNKGTLAEGLIAVGIFMAGSFRMMGAALPLQNIWNELRISQNWVSQAQEILLKLKDQPELLDSRPFSQAAIMKENPAALDFSGGIAVDMADISFTHAGKQEKTIADVTLSISAGSFSAMIGPSGAGKTTIVDLLLGLHESDSGSVQLAGMAPKILRDEFPGLIAYVPQKPGLVSGSFASNIALGISHAEIDESRVRYALEKAQLLDFVESLPEGIYTSLGSQADSLSGGQAQRLGLARALYTNPKLIILDEATSALDAATEASIADHIRNLGDDITVIVVAHRLSTIQHADVVFVVDEGRIVTSGTFAHVRRTVPMIEEYVQLMSFDEND
jgi:ATP-binding cassette subfamily C protein